MQPTLTPTATSLIPTPLPTWTATLAVNEISNASSVGEVASPSVQPSAMFGEYDSYSISYGEEEDGEEEDVGSLSPTMAASSEAYTDGPVPRPTAAQTSKPAPVPPLVSELHKLQRERASVGGAGIGLSCKVFCHKRSCCHMC